MPRIIPLQLLKCLKVLLDDNGGILSAGEVKRISGLMSKYSKKLVSKCIYVQILKCTKTELLGEFMAVGGWTLVYTWLNDGIRAMNWPLVQEILELLLLCPVDVNRLKINSAPKLVKGLCKDGGNEGVRILAKRLVEQWLKVVTENNTQISQPQTDVPSSNVQPTATTMTPQATPQMRMPNVGTNAPNSIVVRVQEPRVNTVNVSVPSETTNYTLAAVSPTKNSSEKGLVYKIVVKNGQQVLAKVAKSVQPMHVMDTDEKEGMVKNDILDHEEEGVKIAQQELENNDNAQIDEDDDSKNSHDKANRDDESSCDDDERLKSSSMTKEGKAERKDDGKVGERRDSKSSRDGKDREKDRRSDKERRSSSSSHKSTSSHKSSSKSSSASSSSKSKSSSSHRSSSDKHRSDKERSSASVNASKDRKEGNGSSSSSSSSKHKSSSSSSKSSSSSSSSSNSKDRHREKDKAATISSSASANSKKDKEKELQAEKDKDTLAKVVSSSPSLEKLGKIPKKTKDDSEPTTESPKPTSITIPSRKASISIEIRRDSEKAKTVKTYKSQFRSHGLTEEAPPPPSRKGLKKPGSSLHATTPGTIIPTSLPSSLKRPSPPPRDNAVVDKKAKLDINNLSIPNEKPGAIKLIAPKKIQTLVETNLFSDALSAATGPKKIIKRKRPNSTGPGGKEEGPSTPTSPDAPKVAPLKFYQDTLDENKSEEKSDKENEDNTNAKDSSISSADDASATGAAEDDDDIPLKKVKEDIEMKVLNEKANADSIDVTSDQEDADASAIAEDADDVAMEERKPGPGCGPNGPPGVLMLHRRKGPKKKLTWRPQEQLEQIRFFELDETERVNVTKSSFNDMKNMERFGERDAINIARRGFNHEDNMQPQIQWRPLIEVDNVPPHPDGNQSKEREEQDKRELTTLRALYFSHAMIPDSPAEPELQPHYPHDIPIIPLDDITGNPDAINDFTRMPCPEPKGSPNHNDSPMSGNGGLGSLDAAVDMLGGVGNVGPGMPFNSFMNQFGVPGNLTPQQMQMQMGPNNGPPNGIWQTAPPNNAIAAAAMMGNHFNGVHMPGSPNIDLGALGGPMGAGAPPQNFMGQFVPPPGNGGIGAQYVSANGSPFGFNGPNFAPMGGGGPMMNGPGVRNNNRNNNNSNGNNGGGWRSGGNFQDNKSNNNASGNWRPAGSGPNRGGNGGICKAFMRGHCRLGKACKFIHPKSKRI